MTYFYYFIRSVANLLLDIDKLMLNQYIKIDNSLLFGGNLYCFIFRFPVEQCIK
jgi:hypothetical protein